MSPQEPLLFKQKPTLENWQEKILPFDSSSTFMLAATRTFLFLSAIGLIFCLQFLSGIDQKQDVALKKFVDMLHQMKVNHVEMTDSHNWRGTNFSITPTVMYQEEEVPLFIVEGLMAYKFLAPGAKILEQYLIMPWDPSGANTPPSGEKLSLPNTTKIWQIKGSNIFFSAEILQMPYLVDHYRKGEQQLLQTIFTVLWTYLILISFLMGLITTIFRKVIHNSHKKILQYKMPIWRKYRHEHARISGKVTYLKQVLLADSFAVDLQDEEEGVRSDLHISYLLEASDCHSPVNGQLLYLTEDFAVFMPQICIEELNQLLPKKEAPRSGEEEEEEEGRKLEIA